jgi:hypothetical protein
VCLILTLSQLELVFVSWFGLCLLLMPWPVPRFWALPGLVLIVAQTFAVRSIRGAGTVVVGPQGTPGRVDTLADWIGVFIVPAGTAALIVVVMFHLARANARVRRGDQAIGSDMPTGCGAAAGEGSCMTGNSTGDRATRPRAA